MNDSKPLKDDVAAGMASAASSAINSRIDFTSTIMSNKKISISLNKTFFRNEKLKIQSI